MLPWLPVDVSSFGRELDAITLALYVVVGGLLAVAEGALVWFALRRGRFALRILIIAVALMIVLGAGLNVRASAVQRRIANLPAHHDVLVRIEGRRFAWNFRHAGTDGLLDTADDIVTNGQLHVPVGKVVKFELLTKDVPHQFSVLALRLTREAVPGQTVVGWFDSDRTGEYSVRCDARCGVGQEAMTGTLIVEMPQQYEKFLKKQELP